MILGRGLIATAFKEYEKDNNVIIFASGVSNSKEVNNLLFLKEEELLKKTILDNKNKVIVYFSSCDINNYKMNIKYYQHKHNMEQLIEKYCEKYYIFRLPQVVGKTNNLNTFFNFLLSKIYLEEEFLVYENASRNIIDIDTVVNLVTYIIKNKIFLNSITNIAYPLSFKVQDIVENMVQYLNKRGNFTKMEHINVCDIDVSSIIDIYKILKIEIDDNYPKKLIEKYAKNLIKNLKNTYE